jgi:hypothetical protein
MFNEIEKLDSFMGMLEADEEKDTRPIFIKKIKNFNQENGVLSGSIIIQTQYDTGLFIYHNYTDGINPVLIVPLDVFPFLKHYYGDEKVKELQYKVESAKKKLDSELDAEKDKLIRLLNQKGFQIIIEGVWTQ